MLWGKKDDDLPDELKGLTPQQIVEALNNAKQLQTQLTTLQSDKTKTDEELATLRTQAQENLQLIEELKKAQKPPQQPSNEPEEANIFTDPQGFVQQQTRDTQNIALISGVMSAKMYARQSLAPRDARIFNKYEKEIDQVMNGYAPVQRIVPDNWVVALTLIKGRHDTEIAKMENPGGEFFSEQPTGGTPPAVTDEAKLTPDEEAACRAFKWDPKKYLESRKRMRTVQGEKGMVARFTNE